MSALQTAVDTLSQAEAAERGAVFTRPEVVEQMLDLLGYTADADLANFRLLEPCFGGGDFLWIAVERLLESYRSRGGTPERAVEQLRAAIRGIELHFHSYQQVIHRLIHRLGQFGLTSGESHELAHTWLHHADFLLTEFEHTFTHVVGNPPYLRVERIPPVLLSEYRKRYATFTHRADLYIPFFECGLDLLESGGKLAYICSDRWIKNRFGRTLRQKIAEGFHLQAFVDMNHESAFQAEVTAYPAITVIAKTQGTQTRVIRASGSALIENATPNGEPWLLGLGRRLEVLRRLEAQFPTLEEVGCTVGIGVATGADKVFVVPESLEVEASQKLPLLLAKDIRSGEIEWSGQVLINPYDPKGKLVELGLFPKLKVYFEEHLEALQARYVAQKHPESWYRLIDPVHSELLSKPKLLIPDIAGEPIVVLDEGRFYPHHNLYWITSDKWDISALQTVLCSRIARLFVEAYSVEMRGGYFRYQAQNLRKIRLPKWEDIAPDLASRLIQGDSSAVYEIYDLKPEDLEVS